MQGSRVRALATAASVALIATALMGAALVAAPPAHALQKHLCGIYGTVVGYQEWCPGISPRHSWKRATAYRNESSGIDMCLVVNRGNDSNGGRGSHWFSRCNFWATSIYIAPRDLNYGNQLTRLYNKNNNSFVGRERRYLFADTN